MGGFERHYQNRQLRTRIFRPQSLVYTFCRRATLSKRCSRDVHSSLAASLSGVKYDTLAVRGKQCLHGSWLQVYLPTPHRPPRAWSGLDILKLDVTDSRQRTTAAVGVPHNTPWISFCQ